VEYLCRLISWH
ncbi:hypothetical protein TGMAS_270520C, partial [Toxoplasma gondii MAS]